MIGNLSGITGGVIIPILFLVLLIIGLWYCKVHSFKAGVYFFLLLIIHKIYLFVSPPLVRRYIDTLVSENKALMLEMTFGELVALLSLIPKTIELVAFIFLIVGLYRLWSSKKVSPK
ncbi:hypothetical protein QGM71_14755 [Virgibacillus sp. C22-A2]|uniref:Uncharacterized protein n=1 Tax=Virgibacillus tibetensis TaxID=3042313 RepID=A0ABU6KK23_9BACI|nr:hypothetical protein [Virgibacillus sp. C22-A2]